MTKDDLMQMARDAGLLFNEDRGHPVARARHQERMERFANAILERAAVECHQNVARMSNDIDGTAFYIATGQCAKAIRALKIPEGE